MLERIECFLLDMDGTFYLGDNLLPGALEFIDLIKERKKQFLFLTNNSSKRADQYVQKLMKYGLAVGPEKILTSGEATVSFINREFPSKKVFLVGTEALENEFVDGGINLVHTEPDIVVLGFDTSLTYKKLMEMCNFIREGLPYLATHPDINCPTENGFIPDIGSFMALIASSTGRDPDIIVGKPYNHMVDAVLERTGFAKSQIAMIGDRLYTDIAMGKAGITTVLVLSGETKLSDLDNSLIKPDIIAEDLMGIIRIMKE
jgi:4-nitrophenyl phosphatase